MARNSNPRGGLVAGGSCESCRRYLGNVLDPYCWDCATKIERAFDKRKHDRLMERIEPYLKLLQEVS